MAATSDGAAVLDRAQPAIASCWSVSPVWPKVALLVCTTSSLAAAARRVAHEPVVGDLEADDVADRHRPDLEQRRAVSPRGEVLRDQVDLGRDFRQRASGTGCTRRTAPGAA